MSCKTIAASAARRRMAPEPNFAAHLGRQALDLARLWIRRSRTRRALRALDPDRLDDIGVSPDAARREAEKPFWRA